MKPSYIKSAEEAAKLEGFKTTNKDWDEAPKMERLEDERITRARAYYLEQAKMQQNMPSVKECLEGDPLPTEHEFRTRNFGLRTQLQAEGAEPNFADAYARCVSYMEKETLALKEIAYLEGVIRTHENINRTLVKRETSLIMSYRSLSRTHLRLVSSFWERLKFLFAGF